MDKYLIKAIASLGFRVAAILLILSIVMVNLAKAGEPVEYLSDAEISDIRQLIFEKKSPLFINTYQKLIESADLFLTLPIASVVKNNADGNPHLYYTQRPYCGWFSFWGLLGDGCRDGQYNPDADRQDYKQAIRVAKEGVTMALAYRISDNDTYAQKTLQLLYAWMVDSKTRMTPKFTNGQSQIEIAITHLGIFYAANLIWQYEGWDLEKKRAVSNWMIELGQSAEAWQAKNNFEDWRIALRLSIASMTNNHDAMMKAVADYKNRIAGSIDLNGRMILELSRADSLSYSLYAINAMVQGAEIAYRNGIDLYRFKDERGVGLEEALDFHQSYAIKKSLKKWPYSQSNQLASKDVAIYELAHKRYKKMAYGELLNSWQRPLTEIRVLRWISLSHSLTKNNEG